MSCKHCRQPYDTNQDNWRNLSGFCLKCLREVVGPKRRERCRTLSRDVVHEFWAEIRSAIAERNKIRSETEQIKEKIRQEVIESMVVGGFI